MFVARFFTRIAIHLRWGKRPLGNVHVFGVFRAAAAHCRAAASRFQIALLLVSYLQIRLSLGNPSNGKQFPRSSKGRTVLPKELRLAALLGSDSLFRGGRLPCEGCVRVANVCAWVPSFHMHANMQFYDEWKFAK